MDNAIIIMAGIAQALVNLYNSAFFSIIKFIVGIYIIVIIIDIILLMMQRPLGSNIKETRLGMDVPKELVRRKYKTKLKAKWEPIKKRMENDNEAQFKLAIIEADDLIGDLIIRMGYGGNNLGEALEAVPVGQIENIDDIKQAHTLRNRIIHDDSFSLTKDQAEKAMAAYEEFLSFHGVLD